MTDFNFDLKDCPFCGDTPVFETCMDEDIWTHNTVRWVRIVCSCGIETSSWPEEVMEEEVVAIWNARVGEVGENDE